MNAALEHVTDLESDLIDSEPSACWLCEHDDRLVYWGLATFGIEYPGATRFICDDCLGKIQSKVRPK